MRRGDPKESRLGRGTVGKEVEMNDSGYQQAGCHPHDIL